MLKNKSIWQECANTVFQAENKDREEQAFQELQTDTEFDPNTEAELDKELEREPDRELMDDGKIEINDYYTRMIRSIPILSVEEELYWAKLAKDGKNEEERKLGKTKLIEHNMRYVLKIAHHFTSTGLTQDDIAQEGAMGLMMAAERFDYTKGYRFTTYATWWIRQKITRAIADQSRTIRIPVHLLESLSRLRKAEAQAKHRCSVQRKRCSLSVNIPDLPGKEYWNLWRIGRILFLLILQSVMMMEIRTALLEILFQILSVFLQKKQQFVPISTKQSWLHGFLPD